MAWYEIFALVLSLFSLCFVMFIICVFDYKYKLKKLEYDVHKENELENKLTNITNILQDISSMKGGF